MLKMARVEKGDVLYDLGCGDGRIVIAATQKFGARSVGIDIDPERIQESRENAAKAGVESLVRFIEQDLFQADIHEANVVSLYLLTSVNLRLRPKLLRELRPGTRLVSHNYGMDEWKPDQSAVVKVDDIPHDVYFWIVPANASGTWTWTMGKPAAKWEMHLEQHFQRLSGQAAVDGASLPLKEVKLNGDRIRIVLEHADKGDITELVLEGKVEGHSLGGTIKSRSAGKEFAVDWKAVRNPATEKPIDAETGKNQFSVH